MSAQAAIGCALLAAGGSRRLGQPKQLLEYQGTALVRHVLDQLERAQPSALAIVLGGEADRITPVLAGSTAERLFNPDWSEGVASSIRVAAAWAEQRGLDGLLLIACDQPRLTVEHVQRLQAAFEPSRTPVASGYAGTFGIPALFPASWFAELQALRGDRGAARALRSHVNADSIESVTIVDWADGALDVDTAADARALGLRGV